MSDQAASQADSADSVESGSPGILGRVPKLSGGAHRVKPLVALLLLVVVVYIWPVWAHRYLPTQDGPSHVQNSLILKLLLTDSNSVYQEFFRVNLHPHPNWLSHSIMAPLMMILTPLAAEKVFVTGYVLLFIFGLAYMLNSVNPRSKLYVLAGLPFVYGYAFHMGFYNFSVSVALLFVIVGYWWTHRSAMKVRHYLLLNLLCAVLYFAHYISFAFALMFVVLAALVTFKMRIRKLAIFGLAMLPQWVLFLYYLSSLDVSKGGRSWATQELWRYLSRMGCLASYSPLQDKLGQGLFVVFVLLFVLTIARRIAGAVRREAPAVVPADIFLVMAIVGLFLYFKLPNRPATIGGFVSSRLCMYPFLCILPWLSADFHKAARIALAAALVVFSAVYFRENVRFYGGINEQMSEMVGDVGELEGGRVMLPLLRKKHRPHEGTVRILPFQHASAYYTIDAGLVTLHNYECKMGYFPLIFRPERDPYAFMPGFNQPGARVNPKRYPVPIDYVSVRGHGAGKNVPRFLEQGYRLVAENADVRLYAAEELGP